MKKIQFPLIAVGLAMVVGLTSPAYAGTLKLDVEADPSSFSTVLGSTGGGGPFFIPGLLFEAGTDNEVGTFLCWGWNNFGQTPFPTMVSQEFDIDGCGKIQTQGVEDAGARAVTGGTGRFRNARGEITGSVFAPNGLDFTATFELIGADCDLDDSDSDSD